MEGLPDRLARPLDPPPALSASGLARLIDHTLLKPEANETQIRHLCTEALEHRFASVCVNASWVPLCAGLLAGSDVKVCTVIGFPLGATLSSVKAFEAAAAIKAGATEVDMVINVGRLKSGDLTGVYDDIAAVVEAAQRSAVLVKVIIETALLNEQEKVAAALLAKEAGADFVKTSTGFSGGGATVEDIRLLRLVVGPELGIKASGGVRTAETALALVAAGATRIGASAGIAIVEEFGAGDAPAGAEAKMGDAY
ncbi:MAG: deoxyribose-phosphate aldolase [Chloroflexi bacterium]|nr:MAG: deoxyribose-phosphate aldolase [Chloroflexota bacterium]